MTFDMQDLLAHYEIATSNDICLLWDEDLPPELDEITMGVVHKKIAVSWELAEI